MEIGKKINYNTKRKISEGTIGEITEYYIKLHDNGIVKTQREICDDLMISMDTLSIYLSYLDLSSNYRYLSCIEKIVLSQTDFTGNNKYAEIWRDFLKYQEEQKKREEQKKKYETHKRLSEILQQRNLEKKIKLEEARENLVKTLGKVYEIRR